jgi:hypothetical protein
VSALPTIGLAITTIGRPEIVRLLRSAASSSCPPTAVAVANQSGRTLAHLEAEPQVMDVRTVPSRGGISAGRNDAVAALPSDVQILAFPNDDSRFPVQSLEQVAQGFRDHPEVDAVATSLLDFGRPRFRLPPAGSYLNRLSVWRAVEPATFVRASAFAALGGFRGHLGAGAPTPWQSGEGTDLLLRLMERGGQVLSRPDIAVLAEGERRGLSADELVAKHRMYARGTGYIYRTHRYPAYVRWRIVGGPWVHFAWQGRDLRLSLRIAMARSLGRVEGLLGTTLPGREEESRHEGPGPTAP